MPSPLFRCFFLLPLLTVFISSPSRPQSSSEFWIAVKDNINPQDSVARYFGNHNHGTYGIDSLNPTIVEVEYPPPAFSFDARWINIPGRPAGTSNGGMGAGLIPFDYRGLPGNLVEKDTFQIAFQYTDHPEADFTFIWPDSAYLHARCDSMFLVDPTRCALPGPVNMFSQIRGGPSRALGPSSRRSRCTVSGPSGQLHVATATRLALREKMESPTQAIGR